MKTNRIIINNILSLVMFLSTFLIFIKPEFKNILEFYIAFLSTIAFITISALQIIWYKKDKKELEIQQKYYLYKSSYEGLSYPEGCMILDADLYKYFNNNELKILEKNKYVYFDKNIKRYLTI